MSDKKAGRPPLREDDKRNRKVMLTFTESQYQEFKKMQTLLNQTTLTATLMMFIDRGMGSLKQELVRSL